MKPSAQGRGCLTGPHLVVTEAPHHHKDERQSTEIGSHAGGDITWQYQIPVLLVGIGVCGARK